MTLGDHQADIKDQLNAPNNGLVNLGYFTQYCVCKGQVQQEFMVACETGEDVCPHKGWLHPECTDDLKDLSIDEIVKIDIWYCMDCRKSSHQNIQNGASKKNSPVKSSQKRGGSICIETESQEKKEHQSNDSSLKKQLIIRFTAEDLDEQPRNGREKEPGQAANRKSNQLKEQKNNAGRSEQGSLDKQSVELQANEKLIDPRKASHSKKQQQTFQVNQMKQVKLDGIRGADGSSKPFMTSKFSAFSKSGENGSKAAIQ